LVLLAIATDGGIALNSQQLAAEVGQLQQQLASKKTELHALLSSFGRQEGKKVILTQASQPVVEAQDAATCKRKIFVYDLPDEFGHPPAEWKEQERQGERLAAEGGDIEFRDMFNTDQFAMEYYFIQRLSRFPCRTKDPASADIFFVPVSIIMSVCCCRCIVNPSMYLPSTSRDRTRGPHLHGLLKRYLVASWRRSCCRSYSKLRAPVGYHIGIGTKHATTY
jgi:hypothetical protein